MSNITPLKEWEALLKNNNFEGKLVIGYETFAVYAGLIKEIKLKCNCVNVEPNVLWQLHNNVWIKMKNFTSWASCNEAIIPPHKSDDFYCMNIHLIGPIYIYTGGNPNDGLKLKSLPTINFAK